MKQNSASHTFHLNVTPHENKVTSYFLWNALEVDNCRHLTLYSRLEESWTQCACGSKLQQQSICDIVTQWFYKTVVLHRAICVSFLESPTADSGKTTLTHLHSFSLRVQARGVKAVRVDARRVCWVRAGRGCGQDVRISRVLQAAGRPRAAQAAHAAAALTACTHTVNVGKR